MSADHNSTAPLKAWVAPDIRELDVGDSAAFPTFGADVGGNPRVDCQKS